MKEFNHINYYKTYVYPRRKSLKEGALPTFNLPRPSVNATKNHSTSDIKKERNIHFYKHSYHNHSQQMFINPFMNLNNV